MPSYSILTVEGALDKLHTTRLSVKENDRLRLQKKCRLIRPANLGWGRKVVAARELVPKGICVLEEGEVIPAASGHWKHIVFRSTKNRSPSGKNRSC